MQSGGQATPRARHGSAEPHGVEMEQHLHMSNSNLYAVGDCCARYKGVEMEQHLRTSNSTIDAVGDCCSRYKFTHPAMAMGQVAARNPSTRWPDPYAWLPGRTRHQT